MNKVSIYSALVWRIGLVMILFSLSRVIFYLFNQDLIGALSFQEFAWIMWGGLRFDLSGVLYLNLLMIVLHLLPFPFRSSYGYQSIIYWVFMITNGLGILANTADMVYYRFTLKRTTSSVFDQFANEQNMGTLLGQFILDYWYLTLLFALFLLLLSKGFKYFTVYAEDLSRPLRFYIKSILLFAITGYLVVAGLRGGFRESTRPIALNNAGKYVTNPVQMDVVLNTPFCIIRTLGSHALARLSYYNEQELAEIYTPVRLPKDSTFKPMNVVVFILESFGKEYIGFYNKDLGDNYKGYTPFLDSLFKKSYTFNSFSNGRKSIDGMPSVLASIPSLQKPYFISHHATNAINSLASILNTKGYHSSFFHGAPNGSMGFEAFAKVAGFDHYVGKTEYDNDDDFDGIWGIWDEPFFQFWADELSTYPEPFVSALFSVSSHHPFRVPEQYEGVFDKGTLPIHQCIGYTDHAIKEFFERVKNEDWFENTLFVFTADHSNESDHTVYKTRVGGFEVPIAIYSPAFDSTCYSDRAAQQIDIMPTILSYLNYDAPYLAFGTDMLSADEPHFALNDMGGGTYQFIQGDYVLQFNLEKSVALFNIKEDRLLKKNLINEGLSVQKEMERLARAVAQQYHNRMIDNKLTVKP